MNAEWLTGIGTLVLAAATVVLAGVTVWSVKKNNEANKSLREETEHLRKQEKARLGKLQALDIISNWADEANSIIGDKMFSLQSIGPINSFLYRNESIMTDREAVKSASELFDGNFREKVVTTMNLYNEFLKSVFAFRNSYDQNPKNDTTQLQKELIDCRILALNSFIELQAYVRKHRISLLI